MNHRSPYRISIRALTLRRNARTLAATNALFFLAAALLFVTACARTSSDTVGDRTTQNTRVSFVKAESAEDGRAVMEALARGKLVLVDGCIRIQDEGDGSDDLIVWPAEFDLHLEGDEVRILNGTGQTVARVGDRVEMGGGQVPDSEEQRRKLNIPEECQGPLWIVGEGIERIDDEGEKSMGSASSDSDEALMEDARMYALDQGIPLEEAVRRLEIQQSGDAARLEAELSRKERGTFAGLWIEHEPEYRIVASFTERGEEAIRPYLEGEPFADIVEVRQADATLEELDNIQERTGRIVSDLGIRADADILIQENRVEVYVTDRARLDAALTEAGSRLPNHVAVIEVEQLSAPE